MQWNPFADVADRVGCRLGLLCREAPLGANHFGRPHGAHRSGEQRPARCWGRYRYLLLGAAICGRFFSFLSRLAHFCFCRRLHDIRALDADSFGSIE